MFTVSLLVMGFSTVAFAQEGGAAANASTVEAAKYSANAWIACAAGFGIAIAAFGGALSQARAASTALEGIARNPGAADKLFTPMILGLALIESLVIYALIIAVLLLGKIA
jgi:F-type H+-transporting ATPase subunit c